MSGEPMTVAELIREADERLTVGRLGKSMARETDRDLSVIRRLRNALMVLSTRQGGGAAEVRALPDRETIARAIYASEWPHRDWDSEWDGTKEQLLRDADAVLALFGQEGQR